MKYILKRNLAAAISLFAAALFIVVFHFTSSDISVLPETDGHIVQTFYEQNEETGELQQTTTVSEIGTDMTAVRINDLAELGAVSKVNYVPDRFVQPMELPAEMQIVDLTDDFEFAEKGTLIFVIMNLDPEAENFTEQANRLDQYKIGDYWYFTMSLPQIFSASNIYMNSQLIARHGEIEGYNFIHYNTSYDKVTDRYVRNTENTLIDLNFYTRRETMTNELASARTITIHYQSDGGTYSGIQDFALLGTESAVKSVGQLNRILLLIAAILSAMAFAVLIVLSVLKRTAHFLPELIMSAGVLLSFSAGYITVTGTAAPLFWAGCGVSTIFLLLGAAVLSIGRRGKRMPTRVVFAALAAAAAAAAFCIPFIPFAAAKVLRIILISAEAILILAVLAFIGVAPLDKKNENPVLKTVCAVLIATVAAASLFLPNAFPSTNHPLFWLYAAVTVAAFVTVFKIFLDTEKANAYLKSNLNLEVERQIKDIRSVIAERDHLLQFVSHDLKKPLTSSALFLDTLIEREKDAEQIKALNIVKQNTGRVLSNLGEIASYARYNYIAEPSRVVDLRELCATIYKYCSADCDACGIVLKNHVNEKCNAFVKQQGLENAVSNIILNAVEHAECTEIALTVSNEKNRIVLSVIDNGKGISPDIDAFKPYVSENNADNGGLGLYICKNIIESMNGEITYGRRNGRTVFAIALLKA